MSYPGVTVEWVGGPLDGEEMEVPPGQDFIEIRRQPRMTPEMWGAIMPELFEPVILHLPIQRRPDGRLYVVFHYPPKEDQ